MWWKLYFAPNSYKGSIWLVSENSKLESYICVNGLDLDWTFFIGEKEQKIKFLGEKKCFNSDFINVLYDNTWVYILEIPSSWELKHFPGIDWKSLKSISENEIWDAKWNILKSNCWPGGCTYSIEK